MSYDLYFWKSAQGKSADICRQLADEEVDGVESSLDVVDFRGRLLARWPELADRISPWAEDLGWRLPWGREDLASYFVGLTLSYSTTQATLRDMIELASDHGLVAYDPQIGEVVR